MISMIASSLQLPSLGHLPARFLYSVLLSWAVAACATAAAPVVPVTTANLQPPAKPPEDAEAWRKVQPATGPMPVLQAPVAQKTQLQNGLTLVSVYKDALPLVRIAAVIKSGSGQDPSAAVGLAAFMADVMKMGTRTLSAQGIAEATETQGSGLEVGVDEDAITISFTVLRQNVGPVLDVFADVLRHPNFAAHELERARKLRLNTLAQLDSEPLHVSRRVLREITYGAHPYGHLPLGTAAALQHMTRHQLQTHYATHVRPANMAILVVGNLTAKEAEAQIGKRLGNWQGIANVQQPPGPPTEQPAQVVFVPRPQAPQSQLAIGALGLARDTPDFYSLVICNAILGGLFNSRLNMNLREDKGWTYGVRSNFNFMRQRGLFQVTTGVRTDVTGEAIAEILKEISKMREADVSEEELRDAKNRYSLGLPGYFQTVQSVADLMAYLYLFDLPEDYYKKLPEHLAAVSVADVRRVATTYMLPDQLHIAVVGDPEHVVPALAKLGRGPVTRRDARGHALVASGSKISGAH